jgi:tripartite-type tricarboxylate transporter receptor subunit TctC
VDLVHVPYKGSAPLLIDVIAGRVDMTFDSYAVYREHIKAGKVRPLGVTSKSRMRALPQVPTIAEAGLKGYDVSNWLGLFAPAGTANQVIATIHAPLGRTMANRELREQLIALGIEPTFGTPEELAALIRAELPRWADIVKKSGATVE